MGRWGGGELGRWGGGEVVLFFKFHLKEEREVVDKLNNISIFHRRPISNGNKRRPKIRMLILLRI